MIHNLRQILDEGGEAVAEEWHKGLGIVSVKADEGGVWKLCGHLLEGEADDDGSVEAHAKF